MTVVDFERLTVSVGQGDQAMRMLDHPTNYLRDHLAYTSGHGIQNEHLAAYLAHGDSIRTKQYQQPPATVSEASLPTETFDIATTVAATADALHADMLFGALDTRKMHDVRDTWEQIDRFRIPHPLKRTKIAILGAFATWSDRWERVRDERLRIIMNEDVEISGHLKLNKQKAPPRRLGSTMISGAVYLSSAVAVFASAKDLLHR